MPFGKERVSCRERKGRSAAGGNVYIGHRSFLLATCAPAFATLHCRFTYLPPALLFPMASSDPSTLSTLLSRDIFSFCSNSTLPSLLTCHISHFTVHKAKTQSRVQTGRRLHRGSSAEHPVRRRAPPSTTQTDKPTQDTHTIEAVLDLRGRSRGQAGQSPIERPALLKNQRLQSTKHRQASKSDKRGQKARDNTTTRRDLDRPKPLALKSRPPYRPQACLHQALFVHVPLLLAVLFFFHLCASCDRVQLVAALFNYPNP